jgi:hypothetical protein
VEKIRVIPDLQEVLFSSSDTSVSKQISMLEKNKKIKQIAPRIYTSNLTDEPENIIRRNLFHILGHLYPGAVLSHRSALEFKPTSNGNIFLTYTYTKRIKLPGITLRFIKGHEAIQGDNIFMGKLYAAQKERALLENLTSSRQKGPESKILPLREIEEKLEQIIQVNGEDGLNGLRDRSKKIAKQLGLKKEFEKLNKIISALLSTKNSNLLKSPLAKARAFGVPYDAARITLFEKLFVELNNHEFKRLSEPNATNQSFRNFAFYESYFSNYIEGTEFELEEAKHIITTNIPMPSRDEDSHDILGTYQLVANRKEMKKTPTTAEELIHLLLTRHFVLLSSRKSKKPGEFKDKNNRAGETHFVDFKLVRGTLIRSFDFYQLLTHPFSKAAYMMFIISEIHPFLDGNGRIARVMMNAELVKGNQSKIIIPTVYRDDYMGALKKLTRQLSPTAYIGMLLRAHNFSATVKGNDMNAMEKHLTLCNAFKEHGEAQLKF